MKTYGLLGGKLQHSFSPQIHALLGDYPYLLYEKQPDEVEGFLESGAFDGINVTIPYKKTVIPFLDELSETAKKIGSVNTVIRRDDGTLFGDNTDYYGFLNMLRRSGISAAGKKAVILGSGGTSLTVKSVLEDIGANEIVVISRSGAQNYGNIHRHRNANIIINTTPVGVYPNNGETPVGLDIFTNCEGVLDVTFNPAKSRLLLDAEAMGIPCQNGLPMLVAQAKRASELFLNLTYEDSVIDKITLKIAAQTKNIVLIGMPGSGKSTTGRILAGLSGREFIDTDELIVKRAGKSIQEIFSEDGEALFRELETKILAEVSKLSGKVISTGGGIVTRLENRALIRQNSTVVFLSRPLNELETEGRPLSLLRSVSALAEERLPLYREWSDFEINCRGAEKTAEDIYAVIFNR